ncbi:30S ribosomal protein S4 [Bacteroidia bacterium]|jgi:small subunit ribosomal protein S4|nr:30S ribosomal protein S4 [Bacteroidia bacterium]MDC0561737.1 30S ribosomal protein S4 [Bacteroidia bacterium]MDC3406797.1 30S ribosomal protein S4 [Bacteroidia bacterium]CAI8195552.1 MAG: 30S ribosomal protein S4 [Bacteroidia bacterium]
MARYRGPKAKIARKFREPIFGPSKALEKKNYPPGQHGNSRRRGKKSEYANQLAEKQKAKYTYGLLEKQFSLTFERAARKKGITGENLLKFLEARLDNTVFRMGIAPTRRSARQLVGHKHIRVNGVLTNIPSYQVKPGDIIEVREKSKSLELISDSTSAGRSFSWLEFDKTTLKGTFLNYPEREDIPENIKEQLIVELYSK